MKTTKTLLLVAIFSLFNSAALARAEFQLATVDLNRILNESNVAKEQRKSLDTLSKQAKTKLEAKKQALTTQEKSLKEKGVKEDSKEVQEFANEVKNFNRMVKDSEDEIKKEFLKINKTLTERAMKIIDAYAAKKDLDLVVDRGEKARGPVLYGDPGVDITNDVIKEMDQG